VSDEEVEEIVSHLKSFGPPDYAASVLDGPDEDKESDIDAVLGLNTGGNTNGEDALYDQAVAIVIKDRKCSTSYIQRKLGIGYNKAARWLNRWRRGARQSGQPRGQARDPGARTGMSGGPPEVMTISPVPHARVYAAANGSYITAMKILALSFTTALSLPTLAAAEMVPLSELSSYLNGIDMAQSTFTQINADGTVATGQFYIQRPGRARFEYDDDDLLVIAGGGQLAIFDGRGNTTAEQYPLSQTPLSIILNQGVDLSRSGMVVGHEFDGTATRVIAQDPDRPEIGTLTMVFTGDPVELRQWVVTDQGGAETTIVLGNLDEDEELSQILFSIPIEINRRSGE
jgi:outer membrane lipoprotein-sorting protein